MSDYGAFIAQGKSFSLSVGAASQITPVNLADLGLTQMPAAVQFENTGTVDIWVVQSSASNPTAAFPTAGTTTVGTPQSGIRVRPGAIVIYKLTASNATVPNVAGTAQGAGFYLATIATAAGGALDITLGEGV